MRDLRAAGYETLILRTRSEVDLRDAGAVRTLFEAERPAHVVLAAATVGGILDHRARPADMIADNLAIVRTVAGASHAIGLGRRVVLPRRIDYHTRVRRCRDRTKHHGSP